MNRLRTRLAAARARGGGDGGVTLVEVLVTMVVLAGLLAVALQVLTPLLVDTRDNQERVNALTDAQLAAGTVTRELRAADPIHAAVLVPCDGGRFTPASTVASCSDDLTVRVNRRGEVLLLRYALAGDKLRLTTQRWTGSGWGTATTSTVLSGLRNGSSPAVPLFALTDAKGLPVTTTAAARRVQLTLLKGVDVPRTPVLRVESEATVRNAVYRTAQP